MTKKTTISDKSNGRTNYSGDFPNENQQGRTNNETDTESEHGTY